ncbi:MAG TPA: glycosyltransferase [Methylomirabilota bacterium]|nr:glycosyltransferase [Methylomirabilota bacterium]
MLRVAVLTPFASPSVRGNAITAERIVAGLRERGAQVSLWDFATTAEADVAAGVEAERPALVHAFHALRTGPLGLRLARRLEVPLVVTLTGTDANHELLDPANAPMVRRVLEGAAAVTVFDASIAERVAAVLPDLRPRLVTVPQAARFPATAPFDLDARWPLPADRVLFALPAGIRPVKAPLRPLPPFDRVVAADPRVRLLYVGPVLDPAEGEALAAALRGRPWARRLGAVPHAAMPALLARADVVLNCSLSEGGMANSVLEAQALGRAVLAADIPGNRALVEHAVTGLLFTTDAELEGSALRLARDPGLRARLGAAGQARVAERYPPEREIAGYLEVYRRLIPVRA